MARRGCGHGHLRYGIVPSDRPEAKQRQAEIAFAKALIAKEMRGDRIEKFAGRDNLSLLPATWKVTEVPSDEVIGLSGVGVLEEDVVARVGSSVEATRRPDEMRAIPEKLEEVVPRSDANTEFWPGFVVLVENLGGKIEMSRLGGRKGQNSAREAAGLTSAETSTLVVQDAARASALQLTRSSGSVSSPIRRRMSSSGAARRP
jgi:hypothetical protein